MKPIAIKGVIQLEFDLRREVGTCPKCEAKLSPGATECSQCGVLVPRVLAQIEDPLQAEYRLAFGSEFVEKWQYVVANYENEEVHWNFITDCQSAGALEFAAYRYRRLKEVLNDDIAAAMLKRINALSLMEVESRMVETSFDRRQSRVRFAKPLFLIACLFGGFAVFLGRGGELFWLSSIIGTILLTGLIALRVLFKYADDFRIPEEEEVYEFIDVATGGKG